MTIPFHNLATKNKIVLFHFSPHSTYLIDPSDIGIFQSFEQYHTDAIDKAFRFDDEKCIQLEFLSAFHSFCNQNLQASTIAMLLN